MKIAVIGAGPAGLAAAWELRHHGYSVDIFESHSKSGGCASYFRRKVGGTPLGHLDQANVLFDAGATVLWTMREGEFLNNLIKKWGLNVPAFTTHSTHRFSQNNWHFELNTANETVFINSLVENFPHDKTFIEQHFPKFFKIAKNLNSILYKIPAEPFISLSSLAHNTQLLSEALRIFPAWLCYPAKFSELIENTSLEFKEWANSLLLITLQARAHEVESLYGISALCFLALGAGSLEGGMKTFFENLSKEFPNKSCQLYFKNPVLKITSESGYVIHTPLKSYHGYSHVLLSTPRWNSENLFDEPLFSNSNTVEWDDIKNKLWSAVVAYYVFEDSPTLPDSAFNHLVKNSQGEFYFSVSKRGDLLRGPAKLRIVTASTHENLESWNYSHYLKKKPFEGRERYETQKVQWQKKFTEAAQSVFQSIPLFAEIASPKTFLAYTQRLEGFVGGIPLTREFSFLKSPSQETRLPNVIQVGDTAFPGQSVVNCAVGALEAVRKVNVSI